MKDKISLGFVGAGFIAGFHAKAIRSVRTIDIDGVFSLQGAEDFSKMVQKNGLGKGTVYGSAAELAQNVDALVLSSPNFTRMKSIEEITDAVKKGARLKTIICEKPLARNLKEARRMVRLIRDAGLKTAYFENQIFMKPVRVELEQLAPQMNAMGSPTLVRSSEEHGGPHSSWFWDPTQQGGGVLSDMGCHSIAVAWYMLTPPGKPLTFLKPVSVQCDCSLLKWGLPKWRDELLKTHGVDYSKTPAEDFATGILTFENPETGQKVKAQFTDSWMFEKQGLRLFMDGTGPGYAFEINTLRSSLDVFIGDKAAESVSDAETALEKSTASRGLLTVQHNEADLYGYTDEFEDTARAVLAGADAFLPIEYGVEIVKLIMAAYMSSEKKRTIDLTDPAVREELETYIPLIQQGKGAEVLL